MTFACFLGWVTATLYQQYAVWDHKDDSTEVAGDGKLKHRFVEPVLER